MKNDKTKQIQKKWQFCNFLLEEKDLKPDIRDYKC